MATDRELHDRLMTTLNRLAKWRKWFASWQLGTRVDSDPESKAVRDHREVTIMLRTEVSALTGLLIKKGVFTEQEWVEQWTEEAEVLEKTYEERWPGVKAHNYGLEFNQEALRFIAENFPP